MRELFLAILFITSTAARAAETLDAAQSTFSRLDRDGDASLSRDEFLGDLKEDALVEASRQLRMFDSNGDGLMTLNEFRNVPLYVAEEDRGPFVDPLVQRAEEAVRLVEDRWKQFDQDSSGRLSENEFAMSKLSNAVAGLEDTAFADWDRDADGSITPAESRFVIEVGFGVRRPQGEALRLKNGQAISWMGFKVLDKDRDDRIVLQEALLGFDGDLNEPRFRESDKDGDGAVSFEEWSSLRYRRFDPIGEFFRVDADRNGALSREELISNIPEWQRPLGHYMLPAFDDDEDGGLTFLEFLATPIACVQHLWHESRVDANANGRLEFEEFRRHAGIDAVALEADFFKRLNRNNDSSLSIDEFFFQTDSVPVAELIPIWDADGNGSVSQTEFIQRNPTPEAAVGEFRIFDLDHDGALSEAEFSTVRSVVGPKFRGPLKDPWEPVLARHLAELRRSMPKDEKHLTRERLTTVFNAWGFPRTFSEGLRGADSNEIVSEKDLESFFRSCLGMELNPGNLLHEPSGRVSNLMLFSNIDADQNWRVTRDEYLSSPYTQDPDLKAFQDADADKDDQLTPAEWWSVPGLGSVDPIAEFLHLDANRDGRVDPEELVTRCPDWKQRLAKSMFPGFDEDKDGFLSLNEYRLTPVANPLLEWQTEITDPDNDGRLTLAEFRYQSNAFPLLRREYFLRLDTDGNGTLEETEFAFRTLHADAFYVMNSDGTGWRKFFEFEGYQACGSPVVTPDGQQIAFDAWQVAPQQTSTAVYVVGIDGTGVRELLSGAMPSFSPDGKSVTYSSSRVPIADNQGQPVKEIGSSAWGCQWSPDGQSIAYYSGSQLMVVDVESEVTREVMGGAGNPFSGLSWNLAWSPDSRQICIKASTPGRGEQVVIVEAAGAELGVRVLYTGAGINPDFAWHPNGNRIVFSMYCPERGRAQIYELNPQSDDPPKLVVGQNERTNNTDVCWTPDGRQLIIVVGDY